MPKVSVIIPTYNSERYLPKALESVLNQTFQDFEIIIVDDGSSDSTKVVIEQFLRKFPNKIRYFYQENKGPGAARNRGLPGARGDFVAFLDSDDTLTTNSLEKKVLFLERYKNSGLVFTDYNIKVDEKQAINSRLRRDKFLVNFRITIATSEGNDVVFNNQFYSHYFTYSPLPIWTGTVMMRKSVIEKVGLFRTDIRIGEDADYWFRIAKICTIGYLDEPLTWYQYCNSSLAKQTEKYVCDNITLFKELLNNEEKLVRKAARIRLSGAYFKLGCILQNRLASSAAKNNFALSIVYNPWKLQGYFNWVAMFFKLETR